MEREPLLLPEADCWLLPVMLELPLPEAEAAELLLLLKLLRPLGD